MPAPVGWGWVGAGMSHIRVRGDVRRPGEGGRHWDTHYWRYGQWLWAGEASYGPIPARPSHESSDTSAHRINTSEIYLLSRYQYNSHQGIYYLSSHIYRMNQNLSFTLVSNSIFWDIMSDSNPNPLCSRNVVVVKVGVKSDILCWIYGSDPGKREREKGPNNTTIPFCQHSRLHFAM